MMTKLYESHALLEVLPPQNNPTRESVHAMQKKVLLLLRNEALEDTAEKFAYHNVAQFPQTLGFEQLKKSVVSKPLEKPGLISINARTRGKFDARDTVEFLIESAKVRTESWTMEQRSEIAALSDELMELESRESFMAKHSSKSTPSDTEDRKRKPYKTDGGLSHLAFDKEIEPIRERMAELKNQMELLNEKFNASRPSIRVVNHPEVSDRPAYPVIQLNLAAGSLIGIFISVFLCWCVLWLVGRREALKNTPAGDF